MTPCELCGGPSKTERASGPYMGVSYCDTCSDACGAIPSYRHPIDVAIAKKRGDPEPPDPGAPYPAPPGMTQLDYVKSLVQGGSLR